MKASTLYIAGIVLLLAVGLLLQHYAPRHFRWEPTFHHLDKQPYGCALFDSVVMDAMPLGYTVTDSTLYRIDREDTTRVCHVMVLTDVLYLTKTDLQAMLHMAGRGGKVLLATENVTGRLDSLGLGISTPNFLGVFDNTPFVQEQVQLVWTGDSLRYPHREFWVPASLWSGDWVLRPDSLCPYVRSIVVERERPYASTDSSSVQPVAVKVEVGKGEIWLVRTPKLFTNYGVLDPRYTDYVFRFLTQLKDAPLIRTQAYCDRGYLYGQALRQVDEKGRPRTAFSYFLSQPPLRWALRLALVLVILFLCFIARRRQRPIPVVQPPANQQLDFVRLIGTLYFQRESPTELVRKKYLYFADEVRRRTWIDLYEAVDESDLCTRLASKAGMDPDDLRPFVHRLHQVVRNEAVSVDTEEMEYLIDRMNTVIKQL